MRISTKVKLVSIATAAVSTFAMCAVGYGVARGTLLRAVEGRVVALAQTVASSVSAADVDSVQRSADPQSEAYARLQRAMRTVQSANAVIEYPIRYVYILAETPGPGRGWVFLADAEPVGGADWSPPGEAYDPDGDGIADMLDGARPNARYLEDRWGKWVSGYAPILDPSNGRVIGVAAVDVPYGLVIAHLRLILWIAVGVAGVLGLSSYLLIGRSIDASLRPLAGLRAFVRAVGEGDFGRTLRSDTRDEIAPVAADLNVMAQRLAERARLEAQNRALRGDVVRKAERLSAIAAIDAALNRIQDVDLLMERILREARGLLRCDAGSVMTREGDELTLAYVQNETLERARSGAPMPFKAQRIPLDDTSMAGFVARTNASLVIEDAYAIPESAPYRLNRAFDESSGYRTRAVLTVPLRSVTGQTIGVLQLINPGEGGLGSFSREDLEVIEPFASAATVALERALLTRAIVLRMIRMAEMRDPSETGAHVNRVASYSVILHDAWARRHGVPQDRIESERDVLRIAAMLHDVGKVGIPDAILKKPGRLDEAEFATMKRHTLVGAQLFSARETVLDRAALDVALHHHERWDGAGYPGPVDLSRIAGLSMEELRTVPLAAQGLKGDGIPLFARIVAIADVFDALTSPRSYKPAWSEADAVAALQRDAGAHFDPELVELFVAALPSVRAVRERYA